MFSETIENVRKIFIINISATVLLECLPLKFNILYHLSLRFASQSALSLGRQGKSGRRITRHSLALSVCGWLWRSQCAVDLSPECRKLFTEYLLTKMKLITFPFWFWGEEMLHYYLFRIDKNVASESIVFF